MKKQKTNIQIVKSFMEAGGPLNQVFVIQALDAYAKNVLANQADFRKQMEHGFFNADHWIMLASEWQKHSK